MNRNVIISFALSYVSLAVLVRESQVWVRLALAIAFTIKELQLASLLCLR